MYGSTFESTKVLSYKVLPYVGSTVHLALLCVQSCTPLVPLEMREGNPSPKHILQARPYSTVRKNFRKYLQRYGSTSVRCTFVRAFVVQSTKVLSEVLSYFRTKVLRKYFRTHYVRRYLRSVHVRLHVALHVALRHAYTQPVSCPVQLIHLGLHVYFRTAFNTIPAEFYSTSGSVSGSTEVRVNVVPSKVLRKHRCTVGLEYFLKYKSTT